MAIKTDVQTGKQVEVSDEEMMEALNSGEGIIKQVITKADGSQQEVAIWGGYELDGYDRTLNVFIKQDAVAKFADIILEDKIKYEDFVDPCKNDVGFQMTVDSLDVPVTGIMRRGEGKITVELYMRDERKTCRNILEDLSGEIVIDENDNFTLEGIDPNKSKFIALIISYLGLRRYLLKEGIVQKLYDRYDESSGVVVTVANNGEIRTKLVKGMERPELPCNIFLLGEQMCRPYIDELLGLKSSGVRKPRNLILANAIKNDHIGAKTEEDIAKDRARKTIEKQKEIKAKKDEEKRIRENEIEEKKAEFKELNNKLIELEEERDRLLTFADEDQKVKDEALAIYSVEGQKYGDVRDLLVPQLDVLNDKLAKLNEVKKVENSAYESKIDVINSRITQCIDEYKEKKAEYCVKQQIADEISERANKRLFRKKTLLIKCEPFRAEADIAKRKLDDLSNDYDSALKDKSAAEELHAENSNKFSSQLIELQMDVADKKSTMNRAQEQYDKATATYKAEIQEASTRDMALEQIKNDINSIKRKLTTLEQEIKSLSML